MNPEISLILLTVLAGAGQGVFILLVILDAIYSGAGSLSSQYIISACALSIVFQLAGIAASTSHLGNPSKGWKALLMIKNSWLSREVITLSLSVGFACLYLILYYTGASSTVRLLTGMLGIASSGGFYISSSMVYASVRFIKEWANIYTPLNFLLLGITSGMTVNGAIMYMTGMETDIIVGVTKRLIILCGIALIVKSLSFRFTAKAYVSVNIKNALGINDPEIHQMDMGTPYDHYNTKEYYYPVNKNKEKMEISSVILLAFLLPMIIMAIVLSNPDMGIAWLLSLISAITMIIGILIERHLFFIQGRNLQNLYYNNFRKGSLINPLLSKARKGTPVPIR